MAALLFTGRWLLRDHWKTSDQIVLADGRHLDVHQSGSAWKYLSLGHGLGFGGGGEQREIGFSIGGKSYHCEPDGWVEPLILQLDGGVPVLVYVDHSLDRPEFRYLRFESSRPVELPLSVFPPHLAIQNMARGHSKATIERADPADPAFRETPMAQLRYCILKNTPLSQIGSGQIDQPSLEEFNRLYPPRPHPAIQP